MEGLYLGMIVTLLLSKESERLGLISTEEHKQNLEILNTFVKNLGADNVREKPNDMFGCNYVNAEEQEGE